jgi:pimeloyl-ACP methyl ester carboxylesterase
VTDWGFNLEEIHLPIVLWHGEEDKNVPVAMARHAAAALPQCQAEFYPGEGHLSVFKKSAKEIVRTLVSRP